MIQSVKSFKLIITLIISVIIAMCMYFLFFQKDSLAESVQPVDIHVSGDLNETFTSVEQLSNRASLIVEIEANKSKTVDFQDVVFTLTDSEIKKVYKGNPQDDSITILETGGVTELGVNGETQKVNIIFEENNVLKTGQKAILYLEKYQGPITENAYVVLGAFQGKFLLEQENIIPPTNGLENITELSDLELE